MREENVRFMKIFFACANIFFARMRDFLRKTNIFFERMRDARTSRITSPRNERVVNARRTCSLHEDFLRKTNIFFAHQRDARTSRITISPRNERGWRMREENVRFMKIFFACANIFFAKRTFSSHTCAMLAHPEEQHHREMNAGGKCAMKSFHKTNIFFASNPQVL
jgi:hypothetical protein